MNKEAIEKFCLVLESDRFTQCTQTLKGIDNKRCCLGVACEVYKDLTGKGEWKFSSFSIDNTEMAGVLPIQVRDFFGFNDMNPNIEINGHLYPAIKWNDDLKLSFKEIAEGFRKTYLST